MNALIKLVIPPFVPVNQPSLGVSSLVAVLKNAGFATEACYLNLDYLETIGEELYDHLSNSFRGSFLSGEYIFTPALWPNQELGWQEYEEVFTIRKQEKLRRMGRPGNKERDSRISKELDCLYNKSDAVVTSWAERLLEDSPRIIGFSTTFQQTIPSLALARKVKELSDGSVTTLIGGANCRGDMGQALLDNFPWIDHVISGEGEAVIEELVTGILDHNETISVPRRLIQGQAITDMDQLPVPDFHDYFTNCNDEDYSFTSHLLAESSRGCWWGSKSHCSFCGLNGENLTYRHKSPEKIVSEIRSLYTTYNKPFFMMTDNILHRDVASALHENFQCSHYRFFYEIKANLSKKQLIKLAQAGVLWIQPGIENLSTPLLKHINKGTTQLQNIQTLKWCTELELGVSWNILYNLPGETAEDYTTNCRLIPQLYHLIPPSIIPMRLERFSSYWRTPERYDLDHVRHSWSYDFLFNQLPLRERSRLATYFDYSSLAHDTLEIHARELIQAVLQWSQAPRATTNLQLQETFNECFVLDSRSGDRQLTLLSTLEHELLHRLDAIVSFERLNDSVQASGMGGEAVSREQLIALLQNFEKRQWVISENDNWLSIVTDPSLKYRVYHQNSTAA